MDQGQRSNTEKMNADLFTTASHFNNNNFQVAVEGIAKSKIFLRSSSGRNVVKDLRHPDDIWQSRQNMSMGRLEHVEFSTLCGRARGRLHISAMIKGWDCLTMPQKTQPAINQLEFIPMNFNESLDAHPCDSGGPWRPIHVLFTAVSLQLPLKETAPFLFLRSFRQSGKNLHQRSNTRRKMRGTTAPVPP